MNALKAGAQFIDLISQVIGFRPSKLVPKFRQTADSLSAFQLYLFRQLVEPFDKRKRAVVVPEEIDFGFRQAATPPMFSLLRTHRQYTKATERPQIA